MSSNPLFTVAIACYQSEPYLEKSLGSVAAQTFRDFEAICYVEESTDRSLEMCRAFAARDGRFSVVPAPKTGSASTTRNWGVDHARGTYLVFLDGDDWLATDMLEKLAGKLSQTGELDVLAFAGATLSSEDGDMSAAARISNFTGRDADAGVFSGADAIRRAGRDGGKFVGNTFFCTYRTAFMRENRLYQHIGSLAEDFESTPRIWFAARRFAYLDERLYAYRRRPGSTTTTQSSAKLLLDLAARERALLEYAAGRDDVPGDILRIWANQWIGMFYWMSFHPVSSAKFSDADRRRAFAILLEGAGRRRFLDMSARASRARRLALPLFLLAAAGWQWPAKFFFRKLYYPLSDRRSRT